VLEKAAARRVVRPGYFVASGGCGQRTQSARRGCLRNVPHDRGTRQGW